MKPARVIGACALLALVWPVNARAAYRDARIRHVEPQVLVQRATEASTEEAIRNLPFLPGDRVWTERAGRAEFEFFEGSLLRLDRRSKLDFAARETSREGEVAVLQLWSGSLYVRLRAAEPAAFEIDTPDARVLLSEPGLYRIDTWGGETRLLVLEGQASLETGSERLRVSAGEHVLARAGEPVGLPETAPAESDEFADWNAGREGTAWASAGSTYLPPEAAVYSADLEGYGTWFYEGEIGYVWRPDVASGWYPYGNGHWIWTAYGWTWVPYEPWGWAPFHYGSWGFTASLGWYWAPGSVWGPAWVNWGYGPGWVGWCPTGPHGRPVAPLPPNHRERAVPRGSGPASGWTFARDSDLGHRERARWRTAPDDPGVALRAVAAGETLDRDLRVVPLERSRALARQGSRRDAERSVPAATGATSAFESGRAAPRSDSLVRENRGGAVERGGSRAGAREGVMRELFSAPRTRGEPADLSERRAAPEGAASPDAERRARPADTEREVLRRFFAPLSRPDDAAGRAATPRTPGDEGGVRSQPRSRGDASGERGGGVRSAPSRDSGERGGVVRGTPSRDSGGSSGVRSQPRSRGDASGGVVRSAPPRDSGGSSGVGSQPRVRAPGERSGGLRTAPPASGATGARSAPRGASPRAAPSRPAERSRSKPPER